MSFSCLGLFKGAKARHFSNKEIPKIPDSIVLRYWMLVEFPLIFLHFLRSLCTENCFYHLYSHCCIHILGINPSLRQWARVIPGPAV